MPVLYVLIIYDNRRGLRRLCYFFVADDSIGAKHTQQNETEKKEKKKNKVCLSLTEIERNAFCCRFRTASLLRQTTTIVDSYRYQWWGK